MRRRRILLSALCLAGIIGFVWFLLPSEPSEPTYESRPLSYWLEQRIFYNRTNDYRKSLAAIQHIGTNAIPILLAWLQARDSALENKLLGWAYKQRVVRINHRSAVRRRELGAMGFAVLDDRSQFVPILLDYVKRGDSATRKAALTALSITGADAKSAVPALRQSLNDPDPEVRTAATNAINAINSALPVMR